MNQIGFVIFNGKKMIHLEQKQLHCSNTMSICKIRICCLIFIKTRQILVHSNPSPFVNNMLSCSSHIIYFVCHL